MALGSTFTFGRELAANTLNHRTDIPMFFEPLLVSANRWASNVDDELNPIKTEGKQRFSVHAHEPAASKSRLNPFICIGVSH